MQGKHRLQAIGPPDEILNAHFELTPDPSFKLSVEARAQLRRDIDVAALERLLAHLPPESRDLVFRAFLAEPPANHPGHRGTDVPGAGPSASIGYDVSFTDPKLQQLLEEVCVPSRAAHDIALRRAQHFARTERPLLQAPLLVILARELAYPDACALVIRRRQGSPPDAIVLRDADADPRRFDLALRRLLSERGASGIHPACDGEIVVSLDKVARRLPASWERYIQAALEQVRSSPPRTVDGIGVCRSAELRLV